MNMEQSLWMGDVEPWMDESFIMSSFTAFKFKPKSINLIFDGRLNRKKNFCFIIFNNVQEANNALLKLNGKKIPNTNNYFKLNLTKKSSEYQNIIYVGNLSPSINDTQLYKFFKSKYSSVISASVISDNGKSRGYGFVHFTNEKEYEKCLLEMNGRLFNNEKLIVRKNNNYKKQRKLPRNVFFYSKINNKFNQNNLAQMDYSFKNNNDYHSTILSSHDKKENGILNNLNSVNNKNILHNKNILNNKNMVKNLEFLESNDIKLLNKKVRESIDKMFEYYKNYKKMNEIPQIILYYYISN